MATDAQIEAAARAIYELDPFVESGEYIEGRQVSPSGTLTWDQACARDAEFAPDYLLPITKAAREAAIAALHAVDYRKRPMTDQRYMRPGLDFAVGKTVEELGELSAALGKTLRWGWASTNPELPPEAREPNASWVRREIQDVRDALDNLEKEMEANL